MIIPKNIVLLLDNEDNDEKTIYHNPHPLHGNDGDGADREQPGSLAGD